MTIRNCSIIRELSFDASCDKITKTHSRLGELDNAIDWALCRFNENEFFNNKVTADYYVWKLAQSYAFTEMRIVFKYDRVLHQITLVDIEQVSESIQVNQQV